MIGQPRRTHGHARRTCEHVGCLTRRAGAGDDDVRVAKGGRCPEGRRPWTADVFATCGGELGRVGGRLMGRVVGAMTCFLSDSGRRTRVSSSCLMMFVPCWCGCSSPSRAACFVSRAFGSRQLGEVLRYQYYIHRVRPFADRLLHNQLNLQRSPPISLCCHLLRALPVHLFSTPGVFRAVATDAGIYPHVATKVKTSAKFNAMPAVARQPMCP